MIIHILQEESGGLPDTPQLFRTVREAEIAYVALVNNTQKRRFKTYQGASNFIKDEWDSNQEYYIHFWSLELPKKRTLIYLRRP